MRSCWGGASACTMQPMSDTVCNASRASRSPATSVDGAPGTSKCGATSAADWHRGKERPPRWLAAKTGHADRVRRRQIRMAGYRYGHSSMRIASRDRCRPAYHPAQSHATRSSRVADGGRPMHDCSQKFCARSPISRVNPRRGDNTGRNVLHQSRGNPVHVRATRLL